VAGRSVSRFAAGGIQPARVVLAGGASEFHALQLAAGEIGPLSPDRAAVVAAVLWHASARREAGPVGGAAGPQRIGERMKFAAPLCSQPTVQAPFGVDPETASRWVDQGKLFWVFNISNSRRGQAAWRFWTGELSEPGAVRQLAVAEVVRRVVGVPPRLAWRKPWTRYSASNPKRSQPMSMIEYQDPDRVPLNARDVSKHLRVLDLNERQLAWLIHSLTHERGAMLDMAKAVVKSLQGVSRPMPYLERTIRRDMSENERKDLAPWFSSYDEYDTELSLRRWALNGLGEGDGPELIQAALEYERQLCASTTASFHQTNIGREVWQTLDWCLATHRCGVIEGLPGRGKSATGAAFARARRGEARFFTAGAYDTDSDFFHGLAEAIGLAHKGANSPSDIRRNLESIITQAGFILILDEAQRLLPAKGAGRRPRRIEWIMDLADNGVCIVLIGTDRLAPRIAELESPDWNGEQFRRRFAGRWVTLPNSTAEEDLAALAARYLPRIGQRGQKQAVKYARHLRDVSGLFDLVKDAQEVARRAGRLEPDQNDFQSALNVRLLNDGAMDKAFAIPAKRVAASRRQRVCEPTAAEVQPHSRAVAPAPNLMNSEALASRSRPVLAAEIG